MVVQVDMHLPCLQTWSQYLHLVTLCVSKDLSCGCALYRLLAWQTVSPSHMSQADSVYGQDFYTFAVAGCSIAWHSPSSLGPAGMQAQN